jgi:hypothetical protein
MTMPSLTGKDDAAIAYHALGAVEFLRSGAYVKLADIGKPFGKRVANWTRLESTKALMVAFEEDESYNGVKPLERRELRSESSGKFSSEQGLYAHPDIAIQFAQWCSPAFALWVSRQIRHLLTYGEVNIHYTEWADWDVEKGRQMNRDDVEELHQWRDRFE